ncbi:methionyl aminopeptidase [Fistulifera solaris]|uniref:Methionine aminopeptidase n=1 Tax=Fistulifera solaris TaxID=1519565 RepID=A0A1Z5KH67_FISSO|nr:methionyl aminopeptidase [Fistulifera solaris]|eukprot:GAX25653.1 methionyl aminopeptidase [Fistulifera solaris]
MMKFNKSFFLFVGCCCLCLSSHSTSAFLFTTQQSTAPSLTRCYEKRTSKTKKGSGKGFGSAPASTTTPVMTSFPYAGTIRPGKQTPQKTVPDHIPQPDYAKTGRPNAQRPLLPWIVEPKTLEQIQAMRTAGRLARQVLDMAGRMVAPGITTDDIDQAVHEMIIKNNAYPSPLNYHGYPKSCCTSVNEVICHGIPDDRPLQAGDIINLDVTVYKDGHHGDCSEMFVVGGECDDASRDLLQTTYDAWLLACQYVKPDRYYKDLGALIEDHIVPKGYSTVKAFCGHGVGSIFHTTPNILHYRNNEPNGQMAPGHTFTIEPMICQGSAKHLSWPDDWTATTIDGGRSAQFEHTLLITPDGVEALTGKTEDSPLQFWERESKVHLGIWLGTSKDAVEKQTKINREKHGLEV